MPTYQYACTDCSEQLEVRQSFTEDALTVCPSCEGRLRKVFNAVGVVFKGSGFYKTDSRKSSESGGGKDSSGGSDRSGSSSGGSGGSEGTSGGSANSGSATSSATSSEKPSQKSSGKSSAA